MALNFLGAHVFGGGPAHLMENPAPRACALLSCLNVGISVTAFGSILYGSYVNASFGVEVPQYLMIVCAQTAFNALYYARVARSKVKSDSEWSRTILTSLLLNLVQYGSLAWGGWLCYRMVASRVLIGTSMYFYFRMGRWMNNAVLSISVLNAYAVVCGSYVCLVRLLVALLMERSRKKYVL